MIGPFDIDGPAYFTVSGPWRLLAIAWAWRPCAWRLAVWRPCAWEKWLCVGPLAVGFDRARAWRPWPGVGPARLYNGGRP